MGLDKILSISGKPGLYKIVTQTRNGIIAESLIDKKRISVNVHNNISVLSEIAVYTLSEELPLFKVFEKIMEKEDKQATSVSHKDGKEALEEYFFGILPDYDEDRVYASDIKKIIQWYNLLQGNDMLAAIEETSKAVAEAEAAAEEE